MKLRDDARSAPDINLQELFQSCVILKFAVALSPLKIEFRVSADESKVHEELCCALETFLQDLFLLPTGPVGVGGMKGGEGQHCRWRWD